MTELEQEADFIYNSRIKLEPQKNQYSIKEIALFEKQSFIAGANSKYVEKQKLKFAIEQLYRFRESTFGKGVNIIKELEQKLSEL